MILFCCLLSGAIAHAVGQTEMGWKTRGGQSYYYQSERAGGRVKSRYIGSGETASLISKLESVEREKRLMEGADRRATRERAEEFSAKIQGVCRVLTLAAEAGLEAAGYHRHHRGPWRRRRNMSGTTLATQAKMDATPKLIERFLAGEEEASEEVWAIVEKAQKGDTKSARTVSRLMDADSSLAERLGPSIASSVETVMIRDAYGKDSLASAEGIRRRLAELRAELAGPKPTVVERLLAERVALCWLDCHFQEYKEIEQGNRSIAQADFSARQRDRAFRRYLAALKALASVRKLPIVAVQVNMGNAATASLGV